MPVLATETCMGCHNDIPEFVSLPEEPDAPMCSSCTESLDKFHEEQEREQEEFQRTGRRVCPSCQNRSVKVSTRYTRNYGGGYDTFEKCETEGCDYAEVWV